MLPERAVSSNGTARAMMESFPPEDMFNPTKVTVREVADYLAPNDEAKFASIVKMIIVNRSVWNGLFGFSSA